MKLPAELETQVLEMMETYVRIKYPHLQGRIQWKLEVQEDLIFDARKSKGGVVILFGLVPGHHSYFAKGLQDAVLGAKEILEGTTHAVGVAKKERRMQA